MQKHATTGGRDPAMLKPYISGPSRIDRLCAAADILDVIQVALTGDVDEDAADNIRVVVKLATTTLMSVVLEMEREEYK